MPSVLLSQQPGIQHFHSYSAEWIGADKLLNGALTCRCITVVLAGTLFEEHALLMTKLKGFYFQRQHMLTTEVLFSAVRTALQDHLRRVKLPFPNPRCAKFSQSGQSQVPSWVSLSSHSAAFYHQRGSVSHCHMSFYSDSRNSELTLWISFIHSITNMKHTKKIQAIEKYVHGNVKFLSQRYPNLYKLTP